MVRVGLTGGIASGKSMVADALAARGAVIIDADVLAREVVEPARRRLLRSSTALVRRYSETGKSTGRSLPRLSSLIRSHDVISSELCTLRSGHGPPSWNELPATRQSWCT